MFEPSTSLKQEVVIPSSFDEELSLPPKRLQVESPPEIPCAKKIKKELTTLVNKKENIKLELTSLDNKKRKCDDSFLKAPSSKKTTLRENPFATIKKKTSKAKPNETDNPFAKIRISSGEKKIEDNPFMIQRSLEETKENHDNKQVDLISLQSADISELPFSQNLSTINSTWLSKSDIKDEDIRVAEEEFKQVFERFRNTVVIEVDPSLLRRVLSQDVTDQSVDASFGRKNFKKFKKVNNFFCYFFSKRLIVCCVFFLYKSFSFKN